MNYIKSEEFIRDIIPIIPVPHLVQWDNAEKVFFIVKCMRILKCSELASTSRFKIAYQEHSKKRVARIIEADPRQADDQIDDVILITKQIMIDKVF
jgi:hypothetical protein